MYTGKPNDSCDLLYCTGLQPNSRYLWDMPLFTVATFAVKCSHHLVLANGMRTEVMYAIILCLANKTFLQGFFLHFPSAGWMERTLRTRGSKATRWKHKSPHDCMEQLPLPSPHPDPQGNTNWTMMWVRNNFYCVKSLKFLRHLLQQAAPTNADGQYK